MPATIASVHRALDEATATAFPSTPVVYSNQSDADLSQGSAAYLRQHVLFTESRQMTLGYPENGRNHGQLVFILHVPKGAGEAARNTLLSTVIQSFRSRRIGGATLLNARVLTQGEVGNWSLTGVQIPFYFDD